MTEFETIMDVAERFDDGELELDNYGVEAHLRPGSNSQKRCIRKGEVICYIKDENINMLPTKPSTPYSLITESKTQTSTETDNVLSGESLYKTFIFEESINDADTQKCIAFWKSVMEKNLKPIKCTIIENKKKPEKKESVKSQPLPRESNDEAKKVAADQVHAEYKKMWMDALREIQEKKLDQVRLIGKARCTLCEQIDVPIDEYNTDADADTMKEEIKKLNKWESVSTKPRRRLGDPNNACKRPKDNFQFVNIIEEKKKTGAYTDWRSNLVRPPCSCGKDKCECNINPAIISIKREADDEVVEEKKTQNEIGQQATVDAVAQTMSYKKLSPQTSIDQKTSTKQMAPSSAVPYVDAQQSYKGITSQPSLYQRDQHLTHTQVPSTDQATQKSFDSKPYVPQQTSVHSKQSQKEVPEPIIDTTSSFKEVLASEVAANYPSTIVKVSEKSVPVIDTGVKSNKSVPKSTAESKRSTKLSKPEIGTNTKQLSSGKIKTIQETKDPQKASDVGNAKKDRSKACGKRTVPMIETVGASSYKDAAPQESEQNDKTVDAPKKLPQPPLITGRESHKSTEIKDSHKSLDSRKKNNSSHIASKESSNKPILEAIQSVESSGYKDAALEDSEYYAETVDAPVCPKVPPQPPLTQVKESNKSTEAKESFKDTEMKELRKSKKSGSKQKKSQSDVDTKEPTIKSKENLQGIGKSVSQEIETVEMDTTKDFDKQASLKASDKQVSEPPLPSPTTDAGVCARDESKSEEDKVSDLPDLQERIDNKLADKNSYVRRASEHLAEDVSAIIVSKATPFIMDLSSTLMRELSGLSALPYAEASTFLKAATDELAEEVSTMVLSKTTPFIQSISNTLVNEISGIIVNRAKPFISRVRDSLEEEYAKEEQSAHRFGGDDESIQSDISNASATSPQPFFDSAHRGSALKKTGQLVSSGDLTPVESRIERTVSVLLPTGEVEVTHERTDDEEEDVAWEVPVQAIQRTVPYGARRGSVEIMKARKQLSSLTSSKGSKKHKSDPKIVKKTTQSSSKTDNTTVDVNMAILHASEEKDKEETTVITSTSEQRVKIVESLQLVPKHKKSIRKETQHDKAKARDSILVKGSTKHQDHLAQSHKETNAIILEDSTKDPDSKKIASNASEISEKVKPMIEKIYQNILQTWSQQTVGALEGREKNSAGRFKIPSEGQSNVEYSTSLRTKEANMRIAYPQSSKPSAREEVAKYRKEKEVTISLTDQLDSVNDLSRNTCKNLGDSITKREASSETNYARKLKRDRIVNDVQENYHTVGSDQLNSNPILGIFRIPPGEFTDNFTSVDTLSLETDQKIIDALGRCDQCYCSECPCCSSIPMSNSKIEWEKMTKECPLYNERSTSGTRQKKYVVLVETADKENNFIGQLDNVSEISREIAEVTLDDVVGERSYESKMTREKSVADAEGYYHKIIPTSISSIGTVQTADLLNSSSAGVFKFSREDQSNVDFQSVNMSIISGLTQPTDVMKSRQRENIPSGIPQQKQNRGILIIRDDHKENKREQLQAMTEISRENDEIIYDDTAEPFSEILGKGIRLPCDQDPDTISELSYAVEMMREKPVCDAQAPYHKILHNTDPMRPSIATLATLGTLNEYSIGIFTIPRDAETNEDFVSVNWSIYSPPKKTSVDIESRQSENIPSGFPQQTQNRRILIIRDDHKENKREQLQAMTENSRENDEIIYDDTAESFSEMLGKRITLPCDQDPDTISELSYAVEMMREKLVSDAQAPYHKILHNTGADSMRPSIATVGTLATLNEYSAGIFTIPQDAETNEDFVSVDWSIYSPPKKTAVNIESRQRENIPSGIPPQTQNRRVLIIRDDHKENKREQLQAMTENSRENDKIIYDDTAESFSEMLGKRITLPCDQDPDTISELSYAVEMMREKLVSDAQAPYHKILHNTGADSMRPSIATVGTLATLNEYSAGIFTIPQDAETNEDFVSVNWSIYSPPKKTSVNIESRQRENIPSGIPPQTQNRRILIIRDDHKENKREQLQAVTENSRENDEIIYDDTAESFSEMLGKRITLPCDQDPDTISELSYAVEMMREKLVSDAQAPYHKILHNTGADSMRPSIATVGTLATLNEYSAGIFTIPQDAETNDDFVSVNWSIYSPPKKTSVNSESRLKNENKPDVYQQKNPRVTLVKKDNLFNTNYHQNDLKKQMDPNVISTEMNDTDQDYVIQMRGERIISDSRESFQKMIPSGELGSDYTKQIDTLDQLDTNSGVFEIAREGQPNVDFVSTDTIKKVRRQPIQIQHCKECYCSKCTCTSPISPIGLNVHKAKMMKGCPLNIADSEEKEHSTTYNRPRKQKTNLKEIKRLKNKIQDSDSFDPSIAILSSKDNDSFVQILLRTEDDYGEEESKIIK